MTPTNQHLRSARRCQERLAYCNETRPFLGWALILQAITPSDKKRSGHARLGRNADLELIKKSTRTREKRVLSKEEADAQRLLQEQHGNILEDVIRIHLATEKMLLNLETKFSRLESANDKLADAYDHNNDADGAEQFQQTLNEDAELMDNIVSRISDLELKMMKEELETVRKKVEIHSHTTQPTTIDTPGVNLANIWSQSTHGAIRPPQLDITPFDRDVMKWREFWDQF